MLKTTVIAASLAFFAMSPVIADDMMMTCDDASMMKAQSDMDAMTSATQEQKDMAMKEMAMAKEAMAANKTDECIQHMDMAMKAMKPM